MVDLSQVRVLAEGLDHPECVAVDADGAVWAGGEGGQFYRIDQAAGTFRQIGSSGGFLLGVTPGGGRYVYGCDVKQRALVRLTVATGAVEPVLTEVEGRPLVNPNYAVFDRAGRLYVSDSGHWLQDDGFLLLVEPDGAARVLDDRPCHFPNGLALDDERGELYIAESTLPGVTKLRLADSALETVASLPGTVPDGLALDIDRTVLVGCYRPDTILRIRDGTTDVLLSDSQGTVIAAPTNLAFGGVERRTLYIASLGRWHIGAVDLDVPGLPLCYPAAQ
jgi:gluconolactonase